MATIHVLALDATRQGGAGVYTARLVMELARRGHAVTLVCHEAMPEVKQVATVHEIPRVSLARSFGMWRLGTLFQLRDYAALLRSLPLGHADLAIMSAQPLAWAYTRRFTQVPLVYIPHSLVAPLELASYPYPSRLQRYTAVRTYDYLERDCLRRAGVTVRFTRTAAQAFSSRYGERLAARIQVLPMPIDAPPQESTARGETLRLLTVGRLIPSKNVGFLVEQLARHVGAPWRLDIVGSGPQQEALQEAVRAAGLERHVILHGHRDGVATFYDQADAFVFPSLLENSPVVLLEAMSHGLASLSFHPDGAHIYGANHEIVEHGVTGLLARDEQEFGRWLDALLRGEVDTAALGVAARQAVLGRNGWHEHVAHIESFIPVAHHLEAA